MAPPSSRTAALYSAVPSCHGVVTRIAGPVRVSRDRSWTARLVASMTAGRSTRSSGGYPMSTSSEHTRRSQGHASRASRMRARLPAMSPTVGLSCASPMRRESVIRPSDEHAAAGVGNDHLVVNPPVGLLETVAQRDRRRPSELLLDQRVVAAAAAHTLGRVEIVPAPELRAGDAFDDVDELIDRHELVAADVDRIADVAVHEGASAVDAVVDVHETSRLLSVAPDFDVVRP